MSLSEIQIIFGERLKALRKPVFRTQEDFAAAVGVSAASVKKWESGSVLPDVKHLLMICELLDCDIDYLLGRIDYDSHAAAVSCDYTGLSPRAVEILHGWSRHFLKAFSFSLSQLIEQKDDFQAVLCSTWNYLTRRKETVPEGRVIETGLPSVGETALFLAANSLTNCIRSADAAQRPRREVAALKETSP